MEASLISIATPLVMNEIEIKMTQTAKQVVSQVAKVLLQNLQENSDGITAHDAGKAFFEGVIAKHIAPHKEKLDQLTDQARLVAKVINRAIPILFDNQPQNPTRLFLGTMGAVCGENAVQQFIISQALPFTQTLMAELQQTYTNEVIDQIPKNPIEG